MSLDQEPDLDWVDDEEYVTVRLRSVSYVRSGLLVLLLLVGAWLAYRTARNWFDSQLDPPGEPGQVTQVIVPSGATTSDIARQLESMDIIPNATFFRYYARYKDEGNFQAGEYFIPVNSSAAEAIEILNAGPTPQTYARFTVPEGLWTDEILAELARQLDTLTEADLRAALASGAIEPRYRPDGVASWEGLLFPDTYEVNEDDDAVAVLRRMSDEFTSVSGSLGYGAADTMLQRPAYEVLIVASLVEAEAKLDEDRGLIASVIYNRLREQWPLGIDATCVYGQGQRGIELTQEILDTMVAEENPYACRQRIGLPPTPIGAPGRASLEAAINPPETDYMYYVLTDPSGAHTFATTEEEFLEAKAVCQEKELC